MIIWFDSTVDLVTADNISAGGGLLYTYAAATGGTGGLFAITAAGLVVYTNLQQQIHFKRNVMPPRLST